MFTAPLFLIAVAVGACVPLVLHVIQSNKRITMPFPTLRFLKMADKKSSRRAHMEYFLLWLMRTLIMVLLGLAFAMPTLRLKNMSLFDNSPRDVALVIDSSYSMGYRKTQSAVWDEAKASAVEILKGLGEKDRFCIYAAAEQPIPLVPEPINDLEEGLAQINAMQLRQGPSQLAPAVQRALEALEKDARGREKEIFIVTDNQALPWKGFEDAAASKPDVPNEDSPTEDVSDKGEADEESKGAPGSWDPSRLDAKTSIYVVQLGVAEPENVGLSRAALSPKIFFRTSNSKVEADVFRSGPAAPSTVTLYIDDREVGRRSIIAGGSGGAVPHFGIPPLEPGIHTGRLETPTDNLDIDNTFHFLIQVREKLPTLCVGTKEDALFVRAALTAGKDVGLDFKWIAAAELEQESLHQYSAVFLCNVLPLPASSVTALEGYLQGGGLVALFPGDRALVKDYQALPWLPGYPTDILELPLMERKRTLGWTMPHHPVVRPLRAGLSTPTVTVRKSLVWDKLEENTLRVISMGAEQAFILDRRIGRGRVLLSAIAADRSWSEFPLSPFFLPLIHQAVTYGAGMGGYPAYVWAERTMPLAAILPDATHNSSLRGPANRPVSIRSTVLSGRTVLHAEGVSDPGIYTLTRPDAPAPAPALAVNVAREESDLTPIATENIEKLLGVEKLYLAEDKAQLIKLVEEHRIGRTYGEQLLWLAFFLALAEFFYANRLAKGGSSLSGKLNIDSSGAVKGGAS